MKNNERLFSALGAVDSDLIAAATPGTHKKQPAAWKKWLPAAACFALAAIIGTAAWRMNTPDAVDKRQEEHGEHLYNGTKIAVADTVPATMNEVAIVPRWDEMTDPERFGEFTVGEERYSTRVTEIDASHIGEKLGQSSSKGYDIYTDTMHETTLTYYAVQGFDPACVLAARFEGDDSYYVYVNSWYRPETLEDLLTALNLRETMTFGDFYADGFNSDGNYEHVIFTDPDDSIVWDKLLSDTTLKNVYSETAWYGSVLSISVKIPLLGRNASIWLTEDGHMVTNILDTGKAFYIGEERVQEFLLYVTLHCPDRISKVYDLSGHDDPEAPVEADGGIAEMTTQGYNPNAPTTSRGASTPAYDPSAPETAVDVPQTATAETTAASPYTPAATVTSQAYTSQAYPAETIPE